MFSLKSDNHLIKLASELYKDDLFSDIIFITKSSSYYGHSSLIFPYLPLLSDLVCEGCRAGHEKIVILLPGVGPGHLEDALLEFYTRGDPTKLRDVMSATNANKQTKQAKVSKDTEIKHRELVREINTTNNVNSGAVIEDNYATEMLLDDADSTDNLDQTLEHCVKILVKEEVSVELDDAEYPSLYERKVINKMDGNKSLSINSISGLLKYVKENFMQIISSGLEKDMRSAIMTSVAQKKELTITQSLAVLNSLNVQVFNLIGDVRPDSSLCKCLATLLRENIPETFGLQSDTEDLAERVGDSFTDKYLQGFHFPSNSVEPIDSNWLKSFKRNYKKNIIEKSSYDVRQAVHKNVLIENIRKRKEIRNTIINATVTRLKEVFEGEYTPKLKEVREIVAEMQFVYPAMFRENIGGASRGHKGGYGYGMDGLAHQIIDRLRSRNGKENKNGTLDGNDKYDFPDEISCNIKIWENSGQKATDPVERESAEMAEVLDDGVASTPHTNPNWLGDLRRNLKTVTVDKCAVNVRQAVADNEIIEDERERKEVRNLIINSVVSHLVKIFGGVSKPKLNDVREIVTEMQFMYPAMFKEDVGSGYGFGGNTGVRGLASQIVDRVRSRMDGPSNKDKINRGVVAWKRGKRKLIYGVNNDIWYNSVGQLRDASTLTDMNGQSYEVSENIFEQNRSELTVLLRDHRDEIPSVCKEFFSDYRHLENQFKFLTNTAGLSKVVGENFSQEMDNLEAYLKYNVGLEITEDALEHKYVDILRQAGDHFDGSGAALVRLETDGPPTSDSPFIMAVIGQRSVSFEVWVHKSVILSNIGLTEAISSFLHLAFVCNLQYPRESQTVADIWQRRFALYGDYSGTRTRLRPEASISKLNAYLTQLKNIFDFE